MTHTGTTWQSEIEYYTNGQIRALRTRQGREKQGICVGFLEDGTLGSLGIYDGYDLLAGTSRQFRMEESKRSNALYIRQDKFLRHGRTEGERTVWWENGDIRSVSPTLDGKDHGAKKEYDRNGHLDCIREHEYGEEVRRTGFYPSGSTRYRHSRDEDNGDRRSEFYDEQGNLHQRAWTDAETGLRLTEKVTADGDVASRTETHWFYPVRTYEYYPNGAIKSHFENRDRKRTLYDTNGVANAVEHFEYNVRVSRDQLDSEGRVVDTVEYAHREPGADEWEEVVLPRLPGTRIDAPEAFYAYKTYQRLQSINEKKAAWLGTMSDWFAEAEFTGGNYDTELPPPPRAGDADPYEQAFILRSSRLEAVGIAICPSYGFGDRPLWLRLTVKEDSDGRPGERVVARSWVHCPRQVPLPAGALLLFRLPEADWKVNTRYRFDCVAFEGDEATRPGRFGYYVVGPEESPAFRLISKCPPVPMQRRAREARDRDVGDSMDRRSPET